MGKHYQLTDQDLTEWVVAAGRNSEPPGSCRG